MRNFPSRRGLLAAAFAFLVSAWTGYAQIPSPSEHANFSGRWRMVKDKSDFGGFAAPDLIVRQIEHKDPTLNVHTVQTKSGNTTSADVSYFTDGSETKNVISGRDATSKAFWDGPALMIHTEMKDSKGDNVIIEDRWELSTDKETLTNTSHILTENGGEVTMKLVCQREESAK